MKNLLGYAAIGGLMGALVSFTLGKLSCRAESCSQAVKVVPTSEVEEQPQVADKPELDFGEGEWSEWQTYADFQTLCDEKFAAQKCVSKIEGALEEGQNRFRAKFHDLPYELFSFYAHWGANEKNVKTGQAEYEKYGYKLFFQQTYEDEIGKMRYQTIWVEE